MEQFLDDIQLLLNNAKSFYRVNFFSIYFYCLKEKCFRKILLNGKMLMNYQNIFTQKQKLNQLIPIISKNFLQPFTILKLIIVR